jgi:uncharacterized protein YggE
MFGKLPMLSRNKEAFMSRFQMFLSLLVIAAFPLFAEVELNGNPQELTAYLSTIPETVMIEGKAEKKLPADRAIIQLKISTEDKSMDASLAANRRLREEITVKLMAAGLTTNGIQAAKFSSTPESGFFSDKVRSYKVQNTMKVTVVNEAEFRAVAALIDAHKEISYADTEFELSTKKEVEKALLAEACQDATAKKAIYEAGLNVALTPVRFHNGAIQMQRPMLARAQKAVSFAVAEIADVSSAPPIQFDEMVFNASITVEYRLQAK